MNVRLTNKTRTDKGRCFIVTIMIFNKNKVKMQPGQKVRPHKEIQSYNFFFTANKILNKT